MKLHNAIVTVMLLITSALSMASPASEDLQQLRLSVTDAITNFYMYNGLDADLKYAAHIDRNMQEAFDSLTRITGADATDEETAFIRSLLNEWNTFSELMAESRSDIESKGFPNIRLVDEMGAACLRITQNASRLYGIAVSSTEPNLNEIVQISDDLAFQMADITAQYTGRGTSNVGQVFVGYHASTPKEMSEKFDQLLNQLDSKIGPEDKVLLSSVRNKWAFLHRSISNYNENSVPFLVVTYNHSILEKLSELAEKYR